MADCEFCNKELPRSYCQLFIESRSYYICQSCLKEIVLGESLYSSLKEKEFYKNISNCFHCGKEIKRTNDDKSFRLYGQNFINSLLFSCENCFPLISGCSLDYFVEHLASLIKINGLNNVK